MENIKCHIIIDERSPNNLRIIDHEEFINNQNTIVEIFSGYRYECEDFHSHYDENVEYPLVDKEELY